MGVVTIDEYPPPMPEIRASPYASPFNQFQGSISLLTNTDSELRNLELSLRNAYENQNGDVMQVGEPLLNEEGIKSVIGQIQVILNRITIMSNLEPPEVIALVDFLGDTLARDLMVNRTRYGIKHMVDRDRIYFAALTSGYICMKRASEEGERRFWKGSQQEIVTRMDGAQPRRKGGFLGALTGWGK